MPVLSLRKSQWINSVLPKENYLLLKLLGMLLLFASAMWLNACMGEVNLPPQTALALLFSDGHGSTSSINNAEALTAMLWQIRVPRFLTAATVGAALAVSGYLLQSLSRNYLADPFLTGVSSGAALAVAVVMMTGASFALLPFAALIGGMGAALLVSIMARTTSGLSITRLLLGGIAVSAVCSSFITLLMTAFPNSSRTQGLFYWLAGSVSGSTWGELQPAALYIAAGCAGALLLSKPLRVLSLGSHSATSLGMNVPRMQWLILVTAVVLCGSAVSLSGVVGFVGLVAPYIARGVLRNDERAHILGAALLGATLVLLSDLCARCLMPGQELPLGTLLSLVGAPFFLWLIMRHKDEARS